MMIDEAVVVRCLKSLHSAGEWLTHRRFLSRRIDRQSFVTANALAILDRISTIPYMPKKVAITQFKYTKGVSVEITGHALTIRDLNTFIEDLEKTEFFARVDIKQRPWRDLPNKRPKVLYYTLICSF